MNRAQRALDCVQSQPRDAVTWSLELLDDPTATIEERVSALWALGRAHSELGRLDQARAALRDGIELGTGCGYEALAADLRVSLATSLLIAGDTGEARRQLRLAEPHLTSNASRGRLVMQQGFTEMHLGALDEAVALFDRAEELLRGADELARARLLVNRAMALTQLGRSIEAEADARAARDLADGLGQQMLAAGATQNLGFAAGSRGALPDALRWFADARARYVELGSPHRVMLALEVDECGVLLSGGLAAEAVGAARRATDLAVATGNRQAEAEARLLLARAAIASGDLDTGAEQAAAAAAIFAESERPPWEAQARYLELVALARRSPADPDLVGRAAVIADDLAASGWRHSSVEVRTFAGRAALALGLQAEARHHLHQAAAAASSDGSYGLRAAALLASASLHLAEGRRTEAQADLSAGMALVEEQRASVGSTELRAHLSANATELAQLGLALAFDDDDPAGALVWAERWHAGALQTAPARADGDSPLARALDELRQLHVAVITGTADPVDEVDPDQRIAQVERRIRQLSRTLPPDPGPGPGLAGPESRPPHPGPDIEGLIRLLDHRVLVEYATIGPVLHALVVQAGTVTRHRLGSMEEVADSVQRLVASLGRLAYGQGSDAARRATTTALVAAAGALDERLVAPLGLTPEADVVVVPTGVLQAMPWALVPSLARRPVTVAPSGCVWARPGLRGDRGRTADVIGATDDAAETAGRPVGDGVRPPDPGGGQPGPLLVCGPGLPDGDTELGAIRRLYPAATVLTGAAATVAAVTEAMAGTDLVHLAAHGRFRTDNPMFSSLDLHDGPLTVYDLESLRPAPTTVVLPACDAGRSAVHHGDELLGTAAALLQIGVRAVVAPVTVVPLAGVVTPLMTELHRELTRGTPPAAALVRARARLADAGTDDVDLHLAGAFVTVGTSHV